MHLAAVLAAKMVDPTVENLARRWVVLMAGLMVDYSARRLDQELACLRQLAHQSLKFRMKLLRLNKGTNGKN
jgi:hypothetical protein